MMEITNTPWNAMSDTAIIKHLGDFVKQKRIEQNKTQEQIATAAGINRSTLSQFENGINSNLITFIQILRALKLLYVLQEFQISQQISPLKLAKLEKSKRMRARNKNENEQPKSDW